MISRSNAVSFALGAAAVLVALPRDACDRSTGRCRLTTRSSFAADCAGAADAAACERTLEDSEALALASVKLKEAVASRKKYVKSEGGLRGLGRWRRYVLKKFDDSCERSVRRGEPCARAQIGNFSEDHEINFGGRTVYDRGRSSSSRFGTSGPALPVEDLVRGYEELFQATKLHSVTRWLGVPLQQDPSDAFAIADLLWRLQPDLVIELGTSGGGSAAFYAQARGRRAMPTLPQARGELCSGDHGVNESRTPSGTAPGARAEPVKPCPAFTLSGGPAPSREGELPLRASGT